MNARQLIEAEDPKSVFKQAAFKRNPLFTVLAPYGFERYDDSEGDVVVLNDGPDGNILYAYPINDEEFSVDVFTSWEDGLVHKQSFEVPYQDLDQAMAAIGVARIQEAEDPKSVLRRAAAFRRVRAGNYTEITDRDANAISYQHASPPVITHLRFSEKCPEHKRNAVGARLLKAAYDMAREEGESRVLVSVGSARYWNHGHYWDIFPDEPGHLGDLVNAAPERVAYADGMIRHVVLEAEDPKSVLRQASGSWFDKIIPQLKALGFKEQEMGGRRMERTLGNRQISIGASVHRDRAFVVIYRRTDQNRWRHDVDFTVPYIDLMEPKFMAMMQRDPNAAASMYPKKAWWAENVLALEPGGRLKLDTRPKAPHSIWTHRRKDPEGNPKPYRRVRTLPNGRAFEMVVAYRKDQAPTQLLRLAKQYGPEVAKMAGWAAGDIAHALQDEGVTMVVPIPSQKPLARRLARLVANRLGVPFEDRVEKTGSVAHVPISKRKAVAPRLYSVSGKVKGQVVCLVDDYVVTSASMMAAATHLYKAGARKVVGAALAI